MARGKRYRSSSRDPGGFTAIPWAVLDSAAYRGLSHPARSLLLEIARQFHGDDNGRMIVTLAYLRPRGWKSNDTIMRAKTELLKAGLIFETCKGQRPNRASWHAVTWLALDKLDGYDAGAMAAFPRGAYNAEKLVKNTPLVPSGGVPRRSIAPGGGVKPSPPTPPPGAIAADLLPFSTPPDGDPLEEPSAWEFSSCSGGESNTEFGGSYRAATQNRFG